MLFKIISQSNKNNKYISHKINIVLKMLFCIHILPTGKVTLHLPLSVVNFMVLKMHVVRSPCYIRPDILLKLLLKHNIPVSYKMFFFCSLDSASSILIDLTNTLHGLNLHSGFITSVPRHFCMFFP